jgi:hypothetical protein
MRKYLPLLIVLGLSTPAWATSPGVSALKESIAGYKEAITTKNLELAETLINRASKILRQADSSGDAAIFLDPEYQSVRLQTETIYREFQENQAVKSYLSAREAIEKLKMNPDETLQQTAIQGCQEGIRRILVLKRGGFDINAEIPIPSGGRIQGSTILEYCQANLKTLKNPNS